VDPEIRERFDGVDKRLDGVDTRLAGVEDRLTGVEDRLTGVEERLTGVEERLRAEIHETVREAEERLSEQMCDMQTELLKAFLPWQEQIRLQFRELEANTGNTVVSMKQRMDILERRLGEIEKRLLLNPPAA